MSNYIPADVQDLVKELVAHKEKEALEQEDEVLDRLYLEIMPEEYEIDNEEDESEDSWKIEIQL